MPKKLTQEEFIAKCISVHGRTYDYSDTVYLGNNKPITYRCEAHGPVTQRANDHLSKKAGCAECKGVKRLTREAFIEKATAVHGGFYTYGNVEYVNVETKVAITCPDHADFWQTPHDHLDGHGCAKCAGLHPLNTEEFIRRSKEAHGDKYDYSKSVYVRALDKVTITCKKHGDFWQAPISHYRGAGCPVCGGVKHRHTSDFVLKAMAVHGDRYDYSDTVFVSKTENVKIRCRRHNRDFTQLPHNHLKGSGCPSCASIDKSEPETKLFNALSEFKPITDRKVLGGKELDLYFPEHKLAIEVNGVFHHSDKDKKYHLVKTEGCSTKGIQLLHFTDIEVLAKFPIVVSMAKHRLGVSNRIPARKCEVREVPYKDYMPFFNANHISGGASAKVCYGLYLNGELVSAMSFSKSRFDKGYEWEVIRFATLLDTCVVGGAGKLFSHFVKAQCAESVMSYADRMFGDGGVYAALGFHFVKNTPCGYSYHHDKGGRIGRMSAQRHKLPKLLGDKFDPEKSEVENMKVAGYHRLFDCGHKVFGWHKNKN